MRKTLTTVTLFLFLIAGAFAQVAITPSSPHTSDDLICVLQGGNAGSYMYKWYQNGQEQKDYASNVLPNSATKRLDQWSCEIDIPPTGFTGKITVGKASVSILNSVPTATITKFQNGTEGSTLINFSATGADPDNDPLSWLWSFGDGATANAQSPSHVYASNGTYTASVTASDNAGGSILKSVLIFIRKGIIHSGTGMPKYGPVPPSP